MYANTKQSLGIQYERQYNVYCIVYVTGTYSIYMLMRDERRKEEKGKQGQTNNKAKQHSTPNVHIQCT